MNPDIVPQGEGRLTRERAVKLRPSGRVIMSPRAVAASGTMSTVVGVM
jgi:hypothetical protein